MQTPETRIINQCTYTPAKPQPEKLAKQPFVSYDILGTAFSHRKVAETILKYFPDLLPKDAPPHQHYKELAQAVTLMWEGDMPSSIKALKDIPTQEVIRFAQDAVEAERSLLEKAQKDVEEAVTAIAKRGDVCEETAAVLRREMASMRDAILSEVRTMVTTLGTRTTLAGTAQGEVARAVTTPFAETASAASLAVTPSAVMAQLTLTQEMIQAELVQRAPMSAALLGAIGFFTSSAVAATAPVPYQLVLVMLASMEQKKNKLRTLIESMKVEPAGWLHLERLQFTPLGYERGELVYSLPMLPGETVRLSHREWSRTETEYSKLVYTELETAHEEALSEKSELTQSSNTQQQHSSSHNASASVSASGPSVNISSSAAYTSSDAETQSRQDSAKRSQEITQKASSRSKKEHKITFKVTTAYEVEEQSFREITNKTDEAIRWDFHRLMKKWRIDLYRYDVRLTYDIVIPEPGSYLLRKYLELKAIKDELAKPYKFDLSPDAISAGELSKLSARYGVSLEQPPQGIIHQTFPKDITYSKVIQGFGYFEINLPAGYTFLDWKVANETAEGYAAIYREEFNEPGDYKGYVWGWVKAKLDENTQRLNAGQKDCNRFDWLYEYHWKDPSTPRNEIDYPQGGEVMSFAIDISAKRTDAAYREWQMKCYQQLADADQGLYGLKKQRLEQMRDELLKELDREDALVLRKLEKEELMKGVVRWLLGPTFSFYPQNILKQRKRSSRTPVQTGCAYVSW